VLWFLGNNPLQKGWIPCRREGLLFRRTGYLAEEGEVLQKDWLPCRRGGSPPDSGLRGLVFILFYMGLCTLFYLILWHSTDSCESLLILWNIHSLPLVSLPF